MRTLTLIGGLFVLGCGAGDADVEAEATEAAVEAPAPDDIVAFGESVRAASKRARLEGSRSCGAPVKPVRVASQAELRTALLNYVSESVNIHVSKIKVTPQPCGPGMGRCADIFQNIVFHNDGRMGDALHPFAQRVDRETWLVDLAIYSPTGVPIVVATAGTRGGWLMGVAYFDRRQSC